MPAYEPIYSRETDAAIAETLGHEVRVQLAIVRMLSGSVTFRAEAEWPSHSAYDIARRAARFGLRALEAK